MAPTNQPIACMKNVGSGIILSAYKGCRAVHASCVP
jgi:hypothetical protein